jgi:hypothetical protein
MSRINARQELDRLRDELERAAAEGRAPRVPERLEPLFAYLVRANLTEEAWTTVLPAYAAQNGLTEARWTEPGGLRERLVGSLVGDGLMQRVVSGDVTTGPQLFDEAAAWEHPGGGWSLEELSILAIAAHTDPSMFIHYINREEPIIEQLFARTREGEIRATPQTVATELIQTYLSQDLGDQYYSDNTSYPIPVEWSEMYFAWNVEPAAKNLYRFIQMALEQKSEYALAMIDDQASLSGRNLISAWYATCGPMAVPGEPLGPPCSREDAMAVYAALGEREARRGWRYNPRFQEGFERAEAGMLDTGLLEELITALDDGRVVRTRDVFLGEYPERQEAHRDFHARRVSGARA